MFTDDPLVPGVTVIKAVHITELRTAVNQARSRALLPAANWAESVSQGVTLIKAAHVVELRARLDEARTVLGLPPASYTDPTLTVGVTTVKAVHIQELRQRVTEALSSSSSSIPSDGHASLSYDPATNRITTAGFAYDKAGNQVRALIAGGASQRFQYDAANRLVKVKADNNQTVIASYTYGDSNERLIAEEGGLRTYYACDGRAEYVESGGSTIPQWSKTYIHLGARLLSTLTPNGSGGEFVQYHHPDRLGTRLVTNAQDTNYYEQVTLPFGTALNAESSGSTNRRFTTYDRSLNTGLDYALNRHYDPQQGRFTQVDPIGMGDATAENPQSFNLYAYCGNDPINYSDPSGLGFFSFLKKLFKVVNTIIKWLKVALAVALIAVTIWLAPMLTGVVIAKLLVSAGLLLGQTLGPRWMQTAITIGLAVVGIYLRGPQAIWNFSSSGSPAGGSRSGMAASVGAVTGFMAIAGKKKAGKQSKAKKPALQTVAVALLQLYNPLSKAENREYAGSICENPDGSLFGTVPNTADGSIGAMKSSTSTPCPSGSNRVGTFHTHGTANPLYDDENFSLADRINANNRSLAAGNSVPNFVATPSGTIKRFDPAAIANSARGRVRTLGAKAP